MNFSKANFVFMLMAVTVVVLAVFNLTSPYGIFGRQTNVVQTPTKVKLGSLTLAVEIADTPAEREKGLMNRTSLASDHGMLFIFENDGIYPFWMKNTLIPLDMIWIDSNKKIVAIIENVPICPKTIVNCPTYSPGTYARYVLEVNAGVVKQVGAKVGDAVVF